MALTQTAEYALRAVVWLAQHPGEPQTKTQIADATQVPSSYLPKVFQPLVRGGLITGQRGLGGGYTLVKDPEEISMLDVINEVDPIQRIETCPLDLASHGTRLCPLHTVLNQIIVHEERKLGQTKIAEVLRSKDRPMPLCEVAERIQAEIEASRDGGAANGAPAVNGGGANGSTTNGSATNGTTPPAGDGGIDSPAPGADG
ncbi:MAG: Rrf2 family transcriptional regulator [Planctomycetota bacterium]